MVRKYFLAAAPIALGLGLVLLLSTDDARGKPAPTTAKPQAGKTLKVGPGQKYSRLSKALRDARDGYVIEIDSSGKYAGDVCLIRPNGLTIRGVGKQRAKFPAAGKHYGGKAIWVIRGNNVTVENIEFSGARVRDKNGAGIRAEGKGLTLRNCKFHDCEDGILGGGGTMLIEYCEFSACGLDGRSHNLYIGSIDKLIFRHNYSHHAKVGHLLKSRAKENHILYNYFTDGRTGSSSYVINLPNGGRSFIVGNILVQGARTQNSTLVAYGEEGVKYGKSELYVINNTLINNRHTGVFLNVRKVPAGFKCVVSNNIFVGKGPVCTFSGAEKAGNYVGSAPGFIDRSGGDFRLKSGSPCANKGVVVPRVGKVSLTAVFQYVHPHSKQARPKDARIDVGAYEYEKKSP
ncbi:MAG: right-handed parallel beta-helix repeat-containing protein [Phycisphaerae bacterium]|jgi:hypothetical protein|nr:right-handed parallel beta-helix repeat-containing protein [Phycisphaerae bacterium]